MFKKYPNLSKPFHIGSVTIKNRYTMAPMAQKCSFSSALAWGVIMSAALLTLKWAAASPTVLRPLL